MNTNTSALKAKIRHLCFLLVLCLHLAYGAVPGPCKHSVTKEHLLNLRRLIGNQLQNGCSITYMFTERRRLSETCYIKGALPYILDLLNTYFKYGKDSDNYNYTNSLKNLIYNLYSQKCIPPINEETEDNPVKFAKPYTTSSIVGLEKAEEVIQMYKNLVTKNDKPVGWNCEDEYAENHPESTTTFFIQTSGTSECPCSCTKMSSTSFKASMLKHLFTQQTSTTASTIMLSPGSVLRAKDKGSTVAESAFKNKVSNSIQTQSSPVSPNSEPFQGLHIRNKLFKGKPYGSPPGDFPNLIFTMAPDLISSPLKRSLPSSTLSSPITSSTKSPRIPQRRTFLSLQSATSQPSHKSITNQSPDRSTALVLAKRSLDNKVQGILFDFYSELIQSWITATSSDPAGNHKKGSHLQITSEETTNSPFQTTHMDKKIAPESPTAVPSLNINEDISEYLSPPAAEPDSTLTHIQTHHTDASFPENAFKVFSGTADCKDSNCQQSTGEEKHWISRNHADGLLRKDLQLINSSVLFIIISVCSSLLLITGVIFCKQQRNMRWLLYSSRGPEIQSVHDNADVY